MATDLETAIIRTAAYFSHFSYPLTVFELWKWLLDPTVPYSYREVSETLDRSELLARQLSRAEGFVGLGDIASQIEDRTRRLVDALQKYRVLTLYVNFLSRLRVLNGAAVCNSLAFHHTAQSSDIDLFLVTKPGHTWSARFLAAFPLILFRKRPGETKINPICLSFFAADSALGLEAIKIGEEDPYLAYWSATLSPLFARGLWPRQFDEDNRWIREHLPNVHGAKRADAFRCAAKKITFPSVFSEKLLRKVQENRLPRHVKAMMNMDSRVIVRDDLLKFHDRDRRAEIKLALEERMKSLL